MRRHHKLIVVGFLLLTIGWLAWNALLVESEIPDTGAGSEIQLTPD